MNQLKCVLVGIDFSEASRAALHEAVRRAALTGARVVALHVVESGVTSELARRRRQSQFQIEKMARVRALEELQSWTEEYRGRAQVEEAIAFGHASQSILRTAKEVQANLIVLGSSGVGETLSGIGRTAADCSRRAVIKTLLVPAGAPSRARLVLAFIDFSDDSRLVADQALRVAVQDQASIHFLHVFCPPWRWHSYLHNSPAGVNGFNDHYRSALQHRFEQFVGATGAVPTRFDLHEASSLGAGIAAYARLLRPGLIILSRTGDSLREAIECWREDGVFAESPASILTVGTAEEPYAAARDVWSRRFTAGTEAGFNPRGARELDAELARPI